MVGLTVIDGSAWTGTGNTYWSSSAPPTSGTYAFVRPNAYEPGRANIIIYNWSNLATVPVDLSGVLQFGDQFEIREAQTFYSQPAVIGTYAGGSVNVPMTAVVPPMPIGRGTSPGTTGTLFHVFVLIRVP
jgi:hypothetical protein